ncbi:MAG: bifunctional homocysteine S-methyltransferase/methylenetetrahydrofolate reductase [Chloroflexota bacterium]
MSSNKLLKRLLGGSEPILADGAMGTMPYAAGHGFDTCFDALNLADPSLVRDIHRRYIEAGGRLIETNTFGANRFKLAAHGLEGSVAEINAAGVRIARASAAAFGVEVLVGGSVGPLGVRLAPFGRVRPEQAFAVYQQQIQALAEAGADLIVLETQTDLEEVRQAVAAARSVCDLPVLASLTFTRDDRTLLGHTPAEVARALVDMGAALIGANCSGGPAQLLRIAGQMHEAAPQARLTVMPNAGWPERVGGRILYPATPEYFAEHARLLVQLGVAVIGGCCGTTPAHIAAIRQALDDRSPARPSGLTLPTSDVRQETTVSQAEPTHLAEKLARRDFVVAVEVDPPRGFSTHKLLAAAHILAEAGADVIDVADSPMARMRMSPWAVCHLIQQEAGIETVLHFPTRGRSILRIQGDLLAAHALGTRNVFVVMGDPTAVGDYPEAMDNYDVVPTGLIELIKQGFNAGVDRSGTPIGNPTSFVVGCALDLGAPDVGREARLLHKKIRAGADFALTQPVFDPPAALRFLDNYRANFGPLKLPILMGVLPLTSERHAWFLHHEVPGIRIPLALQQRMATAGDGAEEGLRIARELVEALRSQVQGVYPMPPFNRYDLAAELIEGWKQRHPSPL